MHIYSEKLPKRERKKLKKKGYDITDQLVVDGSGTIMFTKNEAAITIGVGDKEKSKGKGHSPLYCVRNWRINSIRAPEKIDWGRGLKRFVKDSFKATKVARFYNAAQALWRWM